MLKNRLRLFLTVSSLLTLAACGEDPPPVGGGSDGATPVLDASVGECATSSAPKECACSTGTGSQWCVSNKWQECTCPQPTVDAGVIQAGSCKPGLYSGNFKGTYRSGFALGFGIPVEALDLVGGTTGLSFTLNEATSGQGTEFPTYTISNGYMRGTANGSYPFEGVLTGELDCATKKFNGTLEGCYTLGIDLALNTGYFKGPLPGTYDPVTSSFVFEQSEWHVKEEGTLIPNLGGDGHWGASWKGPAPANATPPGTPNCKVMVTDAGVPVVVTDGG